MISPLPEGEGGDPLRSNGEGEGVRRRRAGVVRARALRADQTRAEAKPWAWLRNRQLDGAKFRRQAPVGRFVADFVCESARLIVELDGSHHADDPHQVAYDADRTATLEAAGYFVLRFRNEEVLESLENVLDRISAQLRLASP